MLHCLSHFTCWEGIQPPCNYLFCGCSATVALICPTFKSPRLSLINGRKGESGKVCQPKSDEQSVQRNNPSHCFLQASRTVTEHLSGKYIKEASHGSNKAVWVSIIVPIVSKQDYVSVAGRDDVIIMLALQRARSDNACVQHLLYNVSSGIMQHL